MCGIAGLAVLDTAPMAHRPEALASPLLVLAAAMPPGAGARGNEGVRRAALPSDLAAGPSADGAGGAR